MTREQASLELINKSREGGAWVAVQKVFSSEYSFRRFASPSRVPDEYMNSSDPFYTPMIGWRGKLVEFSKAAQIREQNRACGCE